MVPTDLSPQACFEKVCTRANEAALDATRPLYHFAPPAMWMNDPNGAIEAGGWYHIFFMHDPYKANGESTAVLPDLTEVPGSRKPNRVWAHVKTKDFIRWLYCTPALVPERSYGELKPMSGSSILLPDKTPMIMYTSRAFDFICSQKIAFGDKDLNFFKQINSSVIDKSMENSPVMDDEFRDPFLLEHNGKFFAVVAANIKKGNSNYAVLALYQSKPDLTDKWIYKGILLESPVEKIGYFECPKLFQLSEKWVLVFSPYGPPKYYVGELDLENCSFNVEAEGFVDYTSCAYASVNLETKEKGTYLFSWIPGWDKKYNISQNWGGCLSIPHKLSLTPDFYLKQEPSDSIEKLKDTPKLAENGIGLTGGSWVLELDSPDEKGYIQLKNKNGQTVWEISWDGKNLTVNNNAIKVTGVHSIKFFMDRTIWELFISDGLYCFTGMFTEFQHLNLFYNTGCRPAISYISPIIQELNYDRH